MKGALEMKIKILASILLLAMLTSGLAFAQGGSTTTNIQVQNLSDETAHCAITYYNQDGTSALSYSFDIAASKSWSKYQGAETSLPDGFNGSVVVSCDQPVAAIVNQATSGAEQRSSAYSGESAGATGMSVPIAMRQFYGFDTEISVQNASGGTVDVTVDYYDANGNLVTAAQETVSDLAMGAVHRFNQADNANLGTGFNGSASVSATGNVVVVINQNGHDQQNSFNGFTAGSETVYIPSVLEDFYGFVTAVQVQNVGSAQTRARVTYSDGIIQTSGYIQPNQSTFFYSWLEGHSANFNGSATITSLDSQNLVAVVNISDGAQSSAYNGFAGGSTQFVLPSVLRNFYDYSSSIQLQNVSGGAVDCVITYDDAAVAAPVGSLIGIPDGESVLIPNRNEAHGDNYQGSATLVCTGDVVAIVNQGPNPELTQYQGFDASVAYNGMTP